MARLAAPALACLILLSLGACQTPVSDDDAAAQAPSRTAWIVGRAGAAIGQATFQETPTGVLIRLEFSERALPAGWHGLHLHARGDCSDFAAGFQASGSHVVQRGQVQHGLRRPTPEAGDLPNLFATPAGPFAAEVFATAVTLGPEPVRTRLPLLDRDGSALLIHAQADDHFTQPIGGAGERLACAALTPLP